MQASLQNLLTLLDMIRDTEDQARAMVHALLEGGGAGPAEPAAPTPPPKDAEPPRGWKRPSSETEKALGVLADPNAQTADLSAPEEHRQPFASDWSPVVAKKSQHHQELVSAQTRLLELLQGDIERALQVWRHALTLDLHVATEAQAKAMGSRARTLLKKMEIAAKISAHEQEAAKRGWNIFKLGKGVRPETSAVDRLEQIEERQARYLQRKRAEEAA